MNVVMNFNISKHSWADKDFDEASTTRNFRTVKNEVESFFFNSQGPHR